MESVSEALAAAFAHHEAGRLDAACDIYRRILAAQPDHAEVWHLLGVANFQRGNHQLAVDYIRRAIELNAGVTSFHSNLGNALKALGKPDEAIACYSKALVFEPDDAMLHYNLGTVLNQQGRQDDAIASYRRAIELQPDYPEAHNNLGAVWQRQWKLEQAVDCYRRAIGLKSDYATAHRNLGGALLQQGKWDEAAACFQRALQLLPDDAKAHYSLGTVFAERGKRDEAIACYRRALELDPRLVDAHFNLAKLLQELGKSDEAAAGYRRAAELDPTNRAAQIALVHQLQHLCQWDELAELARRAIEVVDQDTSGGTSAPMAPFSFLTLPLPTTGRQQLQVARRWAEQGLGFSEESHDNLAAGRLSTNKSKITIGYLSADFQLHATAMLIAEVLETHDRERFSIVAYSFGHDDGSPMRAKISRAVDRFVDVKDLSYGETAQRIAADGVDILVDLKGYTGDARTQIVAFRPAPMQVSYLGYPGTLGASFMDYILVDDFVVPADQQANFSEKLVHLPVCYQANDSRREVAARMPSRGECGLPPRGFVFCSFNSPYKIKPDVFGVWMRLLDATPGSVLWLLEGNRLAADNLRREARARGIAAERLVFAPRLPPAEHLARHRLADLFLDTFPVNAHTTASDALWTGCPLVTIAGETFVSRVAGSLLAALGLSELIASGLDEYERLALRLAGDAAQLYDLRARLSGSRATSGLFDGERCARALERAYARMWEIHGAGERPRAFRVEPL